MTINSCVSGLLLWLFFMLLGTVLGTTRYFACFLAYSNAFAMTFAAPGVGVHESMGVDVQGGRGMGVAQTYGNVQDVQTLGDHGRGDGTPEAVKLYVFQ